MTRKIICIILALLLCLSLAAGVCAQSESTDFVVDELGYLTEDAINALNKLGNAYHDLTGVGIFVVFTQSESLIDYDPEQILNGITDYVILVENETSWYMHMGGMGQIIDREAEAALRAAYDAERTYVGGVAAFMDRAVLYFPELPAPTEYSETAPQSGERFLYDEAHLLNDFQKSDLTQKLMDISRAYDAQVVVATIPTMNGGDIDSYVDYVYDSMGFGYGENHDGVLILVCMNPREYRILSNGYAGIAIDPDDIDQICDKIVGNLSDGDYAGAFSEFADECAYYLDGYINGFPFDVSGSLAVSLIIGVVVGLIVALILKGQLKSVHSQSRAQEYVKQGSMHVNVMNDIFLYRNVTRTEKPKNNSSGSPGGTARSKGGGSF